MTETLIKNINQISRADTKIAGGKGASLGEMTQTGIPVPKGFAILTNAFDKFLQKTNLNVEIDAALDEVDIKEAHTIENASEKIQAMILSKKIPEDIKTKILKFYKKLDCKFVAVRSSATSEDSASASWAGQLDSFLNTVEKTLLENIKKCWASLFTPRAIFYSFEKKLNKDKISVAVIVQEMVESEKSGIAFSVHPITEDKNQIIIEAGFGLGEAIVSGSITPDSYIVDKREFLILDINVNEQTKGLYKKSKGGNEWKELGNKGKKQILSKKEIVELSKLVVKIENHYDFPCDIEWAKEKGKFYIVQSRQITALKPSKIEDKKREISQTELYKNQISLTEWLKNIEHKNTDELREEDNEKRERLRVLNKIIDLPFDKPTQFKAIELVKKTKAVIDFVKKHKEESCALRLIPITKGVQKLRMRGMTVETVLNEWFPKQKIDPENYRAEFLSNPTQNNWATIFVINNKGVFGEIVRDGHFVLTQGFYNKTRPVTFYYDWKKWKLEPKDKEAQEHLKVLINKLKVSGEKEGEIKKIIDADFAKGHLAGYFETVDTEFGIEYIDYSAKLGRLFGKEETKPVAGELKGQIFGKGKISGRVRIVDDSKVTFEKGDVLVCEMTTPAHIELMKKAAAIITNQGGILSHAAIVAREMNKICVVGTGNATNILNDGDFVEVNANQGVVKILKKKNIF